MGEVVPAKGLVLLLTDGEVELGEAEGEAEAEAEGETKACKGAVASACWVKV